VSCFRIKLEELLPSKFYGLYLYNSVAMGNFEAGYSDIDFVVILKSNLLGEEIVKLKTLHKYFASVYKYGTKLDGMYLQYDMIGKTNNDIKKYPYVKDASLFEAGYFDINYVTWWSLREYEMAIDSPSLKNELSEICFENVIQTMKYNLNKYWLPKLEKSEVFKEDMWVEFAIVTLSRIIYTLKDSEIKSKTQSCYFIVNEYPEWKDIVEEALAIRNLEPQSIINDISIRKEKTVKFISSMIEHGNILIAEAVNV